MYITRRNRITVFENEMLSNLAKLRSCLLVVQRGEEGGSRIILLLGRLLSRADVREFSTVYIQA